MTINISYDQYGFISVSLDQSDLKISPSDFIVGGRSISSPKQTTEFHKTVVRDGTVAARDNSEYNHIEKRFVEDSLDKLPGDSYSTFRRGMDYYKESASKVTGDISSTGMLMQTAARMEAEYNKLALQMHTQPEAEGISEQIAQKREIITAWVASINNPLDPATEYMFKRAEEVALEEILGYARDAGLTADETRKLVIDIKEYAVKHGMPLNSNSLGMAWDNVDSEEITKIERLDQSETSVVSKVVSTVVSPAIVTIVNAAQELWDYLGEVNPTGHVGRYLTNTDRSQDGSGGGAGPVRPTSTPAGAGATQTPNPVTSSNPTGDQGSYGRGGSPDERDERNGNTTITTKPTTSPGGGTRKPTATDPDGDGYGTGQGEIGYTGGGIQPILLDLNGDGNISITERSKSSFYVDGGDGKEHRTAWAGAGDGVLFFDAGNDGKITEKREFVFTEWTEGSSSDMEALREAFDSNHDGMLTSADAQWGSFKVMVTNADGTVTAKTLTELGITEIKLTPDATHIELPDGSVITGKTSFTQNGVTKTVADTSLSMDAEGHRVVRVESVISGGTFQKEIVNTGYKEDGKIAFVQKTLAKEDGSHVRHLFDDDGDGVVDRRQDVRVEADGTDRVETVINRLDDDPANGTNYIVTDRTVTRTSADGKSVTILRDLNGGGAYEQREIRVTGVDGVTVVTIETLAPHANPALAEVLGRVVKTQTADGLTRTTEVDSDGDGVGLTSVHAITMAEDVAVAGGLVDIRTETTILKDDYGNEYAKSELVTVTDAAAETITDTVTESLNLDDVAGLDVVSVKTVVVANGTVEGKVTTTEIRNANGSLVSRSEGAVTEDARKKVLKVDLDGDSDWDVVSTDHVTIVEGVRTQVQTESHHDGSGNFGKKTEIAADGIASKTWIDLNGDGAFGSHELVRQVTTEVDGDRVEQVWTRTNSGAVIGSSTSVTSEDGKNRQTSIDLDGVLVNNATTIDRYVSDVTEITETTRESVRTVVTRAADGTNANDGTLLSKVVITTSADGLTETTVSSVRGSGQFVETKSVLSTKLRTNGDVEQVFVEKSEDGHILQRRVVIQSEDRRVTTTEHDVNGDGQIDSKVVRNIQADGDVVTTTQKLGVGGVEISKVVETVSRNGQDVWLRQDLDGDNDFDVKTHQETFLKKNGSIQVVTEVASRDGTLISSNETIQSADGLELETKQDLDLSNAIDQERGSFQQTTIGGDGTRKTILKEFAFDENSEETLLRSTETQVSDDGLTRTVLTNVDGLGGNDRISVASTTLSDIGAGRKTVVQTGLAESNGSMGERFTTTEETVVVINNVHIREQKMDVNGDWSAVDGNFDTIIRSELGPGGILKETCLELDRAGAELWSSEKITSANGLRVTIRVDADGDGVTDATTVELTTLEADGSTKKSVSNYGSDVDPTYDGNGAETLNSKTVTTVSANGHIETIAHDLDGNGSTDLRTTTIKRVGENGNKVTKVTRDTGEGSELIGSETTTASRSGRSVTTEADVDGNGKTDVETKIQINADGTKTSEVTYYSLEEVKVAKTISTTSANGFVTDITKDTNGDGDTDIKIHQEKVLQNDGDVLTTTVVDNGRNERLGSITEIKSMDGLQSSVVLDWDGRDGVDWRSETTRTFEGGGDVIDTMISLDSVWNVRSQITATTSGNGLNRYVTTDYDGDHSIDRILDSKTAADGSQVITTTEFTQGLDTRRETTISTSADGRQSTTEIDLNGDGFIDRSSVSTVNLDRETRTEYAEVNLDGSVGERIVETKNFNGTEHTFAFDVGGGNSPEFFRETEVSFGEAGEKITTFSEIYGDRLVYEAKTITDQNGLKSRVEIDTDGDGTVDAVTLTETTISKKGARTTNSETKYTKEYDNDVRSTSKVWVSADGRETRTNVDYDGNGIDDKTSVLKIGSDGSRIETEKSYDKAGGLIGETVTETSADGLITTISRQGNTQSIIRSAVSDKSYVWKGGNEVGYEKAEGGDVLSDANSAVWGSGGGYISYVRTLTKQEVIHEVDAFGIETWRYIERETIEGVITPTVYSTRIDAEAKARILAEAARIYDAVLDRDMDFSEMEVLVEFVNNGELNRSALVDKLMQSDEYQTRYGNMSRAEFINQIYFNTLGRGATLAEAAALIADLDDGLSRAEVARDIAERLEHVIVGNGHMSTNNFDVIMNPVVFERSLDRAFVHEQVRRLVDVVYDRQASESELTVLAGKLMGGTITLTEIAQLLLDTEGKLYAGRVTAIDASMSATVFVRNAFENAFGRLPTETEELRWVGQLEQGRISKAGLVILLANSGDHFADGNRTLPFEDGVSPTVWNGTNGADNRDGGNGQDNMFGHDGADTLNGKDGADRLEGGAGADSLQGGKGQDRYIWSRGLGSDTIDDNDVSLITTDTLILTDVASTASDFSLERSGNHLLVKIGAYTITVKDRLQDGTKGLGIEALQFGDGVIWDLRTILLNTKSTGSYALVGSAVRDDLMGTALDNNITGGGGRDTLTGGAGQDILQGGTEGDRYVWREGHGSDTIIEAADSAGVIDILDLSTLSKDDIFDVLRIDGNKNIRIYIGNNANGPTITIHNQFDDTIVGGGIERIIFSDGIWTLHDLIRKSNFNDNTDSTSMTGSRYDDLMTGNDGNDTIRGGEGDDSLFGGAGADSLEGGAGADEYIWKRGDGADTINDHGNRGNGRDELKLLDVQSDQLRFQRDSNSEDLMIIIEGAIDVILIDKGFFSDSVAGRGIDRIVLSDGVIWDREDILDRAVAYGGDYGMTLNGTYTRDRLAGLEGHDQIFGFGGSDTIIGGAGSDTLNGGSGSDIYIWNPNSSAGDDEIRDFSDHAGDVDTLRIAGVQSNDVTLRKVGGNLLVDIEVGANDFTITDVGRFDQAGDGGIEIVEFDDGSKLYIRASDLATVEYVGTSGGDLKSGWNYRDLMYGGQGNDTLDGGDWGADTLIGGRGDDSLNGKNGSDDYRWTIGDGNDTINDTGTSTADYDRLVIDLDNLTAEDVKLRRFAGADGLRVVIGDEVIRIDQQYLAGGDGKGIEAIVLSDGTVWTLEDIYALTRTVGTQEADTLNGTMYRDNIYGGDASDRLLGLEGSDHLYGGMGVDHLFGAAGSDVYHWSIGDGGDTIDDQHVDTEQSDVLSLDDIASDFASGVSIELRRTAKDLSINITVDGVLRTLTVVGQFDDAAAGSGIEGIRFADGVIWSLDDILAKTEWQTSEDATTVEGSDLRDNIYGRGGNDTIYGRSGHDHLYGGEGADILDGGAGHDRYYWRTGFGNEVIQDVYVGGEDHVDVLDLSGVVSIELSREFNPLVSANKVDLLIKFGSTVIRVSDQFESLGSGQGIERIVFGVGGTESLTLADILRLTRAEGTGSADVIHGTAFADNLYGLSGNDTLFGGFGQDILAGGFGADSLDGGDGDDDADYSNSDAAVTIDLSSSGSQSGGIAQGDRLTSIEGVIGSNYADNLMGDTSANVLQGGSGADTLQGRAGYDRLYGGDGDDRLVGGDDSDLLSGGNGADRFVFSMNTGEDTIASFNAGEEDRIEFARLVGRSSDFVYLVSGAFTGGGDNAEARRVDDLILIDADGNGAADIRIIINNIEGAITFASFDPV
jgi:Ca2+-binding RTX toxin-like protein